MSSRRGQGFVYRPKYKYNGKTHEGSVWWLSYSISGTRHRESSGFTKHGDAVRLLNQRLSERGRGVSRRDLERVTFRDLCDLIRGDYAKNARKSAERLETSLKHLTAAFAGWHVVDIGEDVIDRYATERLAEGSAPASINRELAALRRAFKLGKRAKLVGDVPMFEMLQENNIRKGFVSDADFALLEAELPEQLRPLAAAAFVTGWRKTELLTRKWHHVDFEAGWVRLEPGETKNGEGRQFPLIDKLRTVLEAQHTRKLEVEKATGRIIDAVFFRYDTGAPIGSFRKSWASARQRAGLPGLFFHDLRRTAARNLIRAGVPETVAMQLTGHLTASIFRRYAIIDESMLQEGAAKLTAHYAAAEPTRKVVPLAR